MSNRKFTPGKVPPKPKYPQKPLEKYTSNIELSTMSDDRSSIDKGVIRLKDIVIPIEYINLGYGYKDIHIEYGSYYYHIYIKLSEPNASYNEDMMKYNIELEKFNNDVVEYREYMKEYNLFMENRKEKSNPEIQNLIKDAKILLKKYNETLD